MPTTVQWYVRTALLYLLTAAVLGALYQLDLWLHPFGFGPYILVMHVHMALMGGVVQMIMGVGLWMFPLTLPLEDRLPFRPRLAWGAYVLFNGGLLGRFVVEPLFRSTGEGLYGGLTVLSGVMQVAAMLLFVYYLWSLRLSKRAERQRPEPGHMSRLPSCPGCVYRLRRRDRHHAAQQEPVNPTLGSPWPIREVKAPCRVTGRSADPIPGYAATSRRHTAGWPQNVLVSRFVLTPRHGWF